MNVGLLHLCLLGTWARRVLEVPMAFYNTWGFQQAGYIKKSSKQSLLVLQTISWVFGLCVIHHHLEEKKNKEKRNWILKDDSL